MENPMKARKATLRTIIAIATSSVVENRFAMRKRFRHSGHGLDLDHAQRWINPPGNAARIA
jgi:hypothetical protein